MPIQSKCSKQQLRPPSCENLEVNWVIGAERTCVITYPPGTPPILRDRTNALSSRPEKVHQSRLCAERWSRSLQHTVTFCDSDRRLSVSVSNTSLFFTQANEMLSPVSLSLDTSNLQLSAAFTPPPRKNSTSWTPVPALQLSGLTPVFPAINLENSTMSNRNLWSDSAHVSRRLTTSFVSPTSDDYKSVVGSPLSDSHMLVYDSPVSSGTRCRGDLL